MRRRSQQNAVLVTALSDAIVAGDLDTFANLTVAAHSIINKSLGDDEFSLRRSEAACGRKMTCESFGGTFSNQMYARWHKDGSCHGRRKAGL